MRELKYSEGAAQRRIDAMRALRANPEIEEKIESGVLSLSVVAQAQRFFRHEAKAGATVDRAEVFESLQNKSIREAERELMARSTSPATLNAERIVPKTAELSELRMMVDQEFLKNLEKLRGLLANRDPHLSHAQILNEALRCTLAQLDPAREPERKIKRSEKSESEASPAKQTRNITAATKREVWRRAQGTCEFAECTSCFDLEIDHIIPIAKGGTHDLANLRLLCFQHNQFEAERIFGREFMRARREANA